MTKPRPAANPDFIPPRPWNWVWVAAHTGSGGGHVYLTDANGRKIAALWGKPDEKAAAAELITFLVNAAGWEERGA